MPNDLRAFKGLEPQFAPFLRVMGEFPNLGIWVKDPRRINLP